jgi:ParB family chromosome partitioning protein
MDSKSSDVLNGLRDKPLSNASSYKTVSLADVISDDRSFRITTRNSIEKLVESIAQFGLLHPPVLIRTGSRYKIVCGFRRIEACLYLGFTQIPARVLEENADRFQMVQLAIADNALQRSLNLVETSRALNLLADFCSDQTQFTKAGSALSLPVNPLVADKIKKISRLPRQIQDGIVAGTIGMSMALALGEMDQSAGEALLGLFEQLKIGLNRQRELLLLVNEIAQRENRLIQQLITEKSLQQILLDPQLDRAIKRQKIRSYLQQRRYPSISKAATHYAKRVKRLKLGNNIHLIPPKNFEDAAFTMILRFNNCEELSNLKTKIEEIILHPALTEILDR